MTAARADLWPSFDLMLGTVRVEEAAQPGFRVDIIETLDLQEIPEGVLAFDGEVPFDGHCRMIDAGDVFH
ncbi:MAG: serine kinase, partial [Mesorhizobium sp.]